MATTTKVYIIYYSLYGHVESMAREIQKGANSVEGVVATLWQVPETLPDRVLQKMKAPPKPDDVPEIMPEQLAEADGFIFGFPSRFGVMAAQCKAFFDATHEIWTAQALAGKPAGIFWSTGFHGGGQELTALTAITQLAHHGMIFVPLGYTFGRGMFEMEQVKGGSSYGAGTYAADGSRHPTDIELQQAFYQGKYVAEITIKIEDQVPSINTLGEHKALSKLDTVIVSISTYSYSMTNYCQSAMSFHEKSRGRSLNVILLGVTDQQFQIHSIFSELKYNVTIQFHITIHE